MPLDTPTIAPQRQTSAREKAPTKIGFVSLGCPKNLVDSEVMMGLLQRGGAEITSHADDAVVGTGELEHILAAAGIESAGETGGDHSPFVILNSGPSALSQSQALKSG